MRALNHRERLFALYYCGEAKGNARLAAEMAGYSPNTGSQLLRRPLVNLLVQRKTERAALTADEVLALVSDQATANMDDFLSYMEVEPAEYDDEGNVVKPAKQELRFDYAKAKRRGKLHLLKKFEILPGGNVRFELHDSAGALEKLMKYHGLGRDRIELTQITANDDTLRRVTAVLCGVAKLQGTHFYREGVGADQPSALCDSSVGGQVDSSPALESAESTASVGVREED